MTSPAPDVDPIHDFPTPDGDPDGDLARTKQSSRILKILGPVRLRLWLRRSRHWPWPLRRARFGPIYPCRRPYRPPRDRRFGAASTPAAPKTSEGSCAALDVSAPIAPWLVASAAPTLSREVGAVLGVLDMAANAPRKHLRVSARGHEVSHLGRCKQMDEGRHSAEHVPGYRCDRAGWQRGGVLRKVPCQLCRGAVEEHLGAHLVGARDRTHAALPVGPLALCHSINHSSCRPQLTAYRARASKDSFCSTSVALLPPSDTSSALNSQAARTCIFEGQPT
jgi:hypothetical protein